MKNDKILTVPILKQREKIMVLSSPEIDSLYYQYNRNKKDVYVPEKDIVIRHRQENYKMWKHGHKFDFPYSKNKKGWKKTPRTLKNQEVFKEKILETSLNGERIEGTCRNEQKVIYFYDSRTDRNIIYDVETKEFRSA